MTTGFVSRHTPSRIATGAKAPARMNQAEEMVQIPWFTQLCLEGRIFVAGHGISEDGIDSEGSADDQTPSIALSAPSGGTLVLPLYLRAYFDTEGGAGLPTLLMAYVQEDKLGPSSSTAFGILNCLGGTSPRKPQAACVNSVSAMTAIVAAENVVVHERTHLLDNMISVERLSGVQGVEVFAPDGGGTGSSFEFIWKPEMPIVLAAGSAILFYGNMSAGTDWKFNATIAWAELDEDKYEV